MVWRSEKALTHINKKKRKNKSSLTRGQKSRPQLDRGLTEMWPSQGRPRRGIYNLSFLALCVCPLNESWARVFYFFFLGMQGDRTPGGLGGWALFVQGGLELLQFDNCSMIERLLLSPPLALSPYRACDAGFYYWFPAIKVYYSIFVDVNKPDDRIVYSE